MRLFDTHCHFETEDADTLAAILARARAAGVEKIVAVGGSDALNAAALAAQRIANGNADFQRGDSEDAILQREDSEGAILQRGDSRDAETRRFPEVQVAIGYDREQITATPTTGLYNSACGRADSMSPPRRGHRPRPTPDATDPFPWLKKPVQAPAPSPVQAPVAIGEIGLDYHYSPETRDAQRALFAAQLDFARQNGKPVVIHTREAADDTIGLLKEIPSRGVIHCFTGEPSEARAYLDLGFYVSISGIVTFKAADNVRATARTIPDDRILIETDSPFLAPVPLRGRPNEPAFIRHTCEFLASERGLSPAKLAEMTFFNAERAFS